MKGPGGSTKPNDRHDETRLKHNCAIQSTLEPPFLPRPGLICRAFFFCRVAAPGHGQPELATAALDFLRHIKYIIATVAYLFFSENRSFT
jgi:hypothetical protein